MKAIPGAPGLPEPYDRLKQPAQKGKELMRLLINSYGKTWHTWHTGRHDGEPGTPLPTGDPVLMWSFNREGECDTALAEDRNRTMEIDTVTKAADRQDFVAISHPQHGVDDMAGDFTGTRPIPGVVDENARDR